MTHFGMLNSCFHPPLVNTVRGKLHNVAFPRLYAVDSFFPRDIIFEWRRRKSVSLVAAFTGQYTLGARYVCHIGYVLVALIPLLCTRANHKPRVLQLCVGIHAATIMFTVYRILKAFCLLVRVLQQSHFPVCRPILPRQFIVWYEPSHVKGPDLPI